MASVGELRRLWVPCEVHAADARDETNPLGAQDAPPGAPLARRSPRRLGGAEGHDADEDDGAHRVPVSMTQRLRAADELLAV